MASESLFSAVAPVSVPSEEDMLTSDLRSSVTLLPSSSSYENFSIKELVSSIRSVLLLSSINNVLELVSDEQISGLASGALYERSSSSGSKSIYIQRKCPIRNEYIQCARVNIEAIQSLIISKEKVYKNNV